MVLRCYSDFFLINNYKYLFFFQRCFSKAPILHYGLEGIQGRPTVPSQIVPRLSSPISKDLAKLRNKCSVYTSAILITVLGVAILSWKWCFKYKLITLPTERYILYEQLQLKCLHHCELVMAVACGGGSRSGDGVCLNVNEQPPASRLPPMCVLDPPFLLTTSSTVPSVLCPSVYSFSRSWFKARSWKKPVVSALSPEFSPSDVKRKASLLSRLTNPSSSSSWTEVSRTTDR